MPSTKIETRMGKGKWEKLLTYLQRETRRAKRRGWSKGRQDFIQAMAQVVWVIQNTGRGKAPRYPRDLRPEPHEFVLEVRRSKRVWGK